MTYDKQLEYKQGVIRNLFTSLFEGEISSIVPSPLEWNYRNKMEYTFSQNKAGERFLGLMKAGTKGRVETLSECHLSPNWFIQVLSAVKTWWDLSDLLAFHGVQDIGSLRNLTVREGKKTGQKMVILTVSGNPAYALKKEHLTSFVSAVQSALGDAETPSIFLRIQQAVRGQPTQFYEMNLLGSNHIEEELEISCLDYKRSYRFKVSPTAFFQPNTLQAERLYSKALEVAGPKKRNLILDLYAGTSTLGMMFSPFAEKVIAIELNPYAVFDAEANRDLNEVNNLEVFQGDVSKVLKELKEKDSSFKPDLIVLDPPRTGLFPEAVEEVLSLAPSEILYISCAPEKQVRDCLLFKQAGYKIVAIQPVDQFPQTIHIENIVLLRR
jgi:23S rRNA (uracil1939-C5)-methyltransferase